MTRLPFVIGTVCVYGLAAHAAHTRIDIDHVARPSNIVVDGYLEDVVERMLQRSPTFRDQSAYLGSLQHVRVRVLVAPSPMPFGQASWRARTAIRRYQYGRIDAVVRLLTRHNTPELIAHELEHVREYVDGLRFQVLAARLGTNVWETVGGHYETARAIATGRRVAEEVKTGIPSN